MHVISMKYKMNIFLGKDNVYITQWSSLKCRGCYESVHVYAKGWVMYAQNFKMLCVHSKLEKDLLMRTSLVFVSLHGLILESRHNKRCLIIKDTSVNTTWVAHSTM